MPDIKTVLLFQLVLTAAGFDLAVGCIPNGLTACGMLLGALSLTVSGGLSGLAVSAAGLLVPFLVLWVLFYFRMLGAGDIKLLCMIGSFLGPLPALEVIFFSFLWGGVMSFTMLIRQRQLLLRFHCFLRYLTDYIRSGVRKPYVIPGEDAGLMCFGPAILLGLLTFALGGRLI